MAKIQCKMCGGLNDLPDGVTSGECTYCGSLTTFPKIGDTQTEQLYARAEHFRRNGNFDKAVSTYESILNRNAEDPEAYWGLLISRYGIEYVEDPATHERIPTCHRVQFDSILADSDYLNALKYASPAERDIYEKEANRIAEIQKGILRISAQEKPYDVFICYKEATDGGTRTKDSALAQDIYYQLTKHGMKVFFARITLEDKLGRQYEPYIFAALNSAKVMLVLGTKKEFFEAVWVKNEWSRFLALMKKDSSKLLIPCFKDMDAYDIPEELSMFQCEDMSRIGFMQDILHGIAKVVNASKAEAKSAASPASGSFELSRLIRRISILMEQQDWDKAREVCDTGLNIDPENPELYLMMCMVMRRISSEDALRNCRQNLSVDKNFRMALKFASPERKKRLETISREASYSFHLMKCMDSYHVSDISQLAHGVIPLKDDPDFRVALELAATPEQRRRMEEIGRETQFNYHLMKCMNSYHVADLSQLARTLAPLKDDPDFQAALELASPERRTQMEEILNASNLSYEQQNIALPGGVAMTMVRILADAFTMSARDGENEPCEVVHTATLKRDFYLAKTEVTQAQWMAAMGNNPSKHYGNNMPVEKVSWNDAMEFCARLNAAGAAPYGWFFTLPTETQWEYAARGGNKSKGYKYSGSDNVDEVAWYNGNIDAGDRYDGDSDGHPPVGQKKANELGLFDMSGSLWEWCLDDWNDDSSKLLEEFVRGNDLTESYRACRGGSWVNGAKFCRSSVRSKRSPHDRRDYIGFRPALVPIPGMGS